MMKDTLIIGYDNSDGQDTSTLVVVRGIYPKMYFLKIFHDKEAEELYELLTHRDEVQKQQHHLGMNAQQIIIDEPGGIK